MAFETFDPLRSIQRHGLENPVFLEGRGAAHTRLNLLTHEPFAPCLGEGLFDRFRFNRLRHHHHAIEIADALEQYLDPLGVMVVQEGHHMCGSLRGVKKHGVNMVTTAKRGEFRTNRDLREMVPAVLTAELAGDMDEPRGWLAAEFERRGGYAWERRIDEVLQGLSLDGRRDQPVGSLSGGEKNVVALARVLLEEPQVLLLDDPTRGVDVGAKYEIYEIIDQIAARGTGVLFISSEIEELTGMCDRILVMGQGEILGSFDRADFDQEAILRSAFREDAA